MSEEPIARREVFSKVLGASALFTAAAANAEVDYAGVGFLGGAKTIDVNNANIRVYQKLPGVYPNAAGKIVSKAPYKGKEDMYAKAGFSSAEARGKKALQDKRDEEARVKAEKAAAKAAKAAADAAAKEQTAAAAAKQADAKKNASPTKPVYYQ